MEGGDTYKYGPDFLASFDLLRRRQDQRPFLRGEDGEQRRQLAGRSLSLSLSVKRKMQDLLTQPSLLTSSATWADVPHPKMTRAGKAL